MLADSHQEAQLMQYEGWTQDLAHPTQALTADPPQAPLTSHFFLF